MEQNWQELLLAGLAQMSGWEVVAAFLGFAYIIYAARESKWCWPLAFVSTVIYSLLFWEGQLPMQALLNFYYMGMAVYGYWLWCRQGDVENNLPIRYWPWVNQLVFIFVGTLLSWLIATQVLSLETSKSPYLDASVTVFSVMNTWLMARKIMQSWLNWVVIDAAAVVLYFDSGYYPTALLFAIYTVLAIVGYLNWQRLHGLQNKAVI